jgi:transcriptional regulator with XRE-family HTH domain
MSREPGSRIRNYDIEPAFNPFGPKAVEPHSPWQLLLEKTRADKKITLRELASRAQVPAGTLFNWVRSKRGCPSRSTYTAQVNSRFAKALGIPEQKLADAYNSSVFKPLDINEKPNAPRPAPQVGENASAFTVDGLKRFLAHLRASGRSEFSMTELELAASFILGAPVKPLDGSKESANGKTTRKNQNR